MKIVHIATTTSGGAGIAARRLNASLKFAGIDSVLITGTSRAKSPRENEKVIGKTTLQRILSKALTYIQSRVIQSDKYLVTALSIRVLNLDVIRNENPDIIHIHSTYNFLDSDSILELCNLGRPVFLTLHDERFFTGGCHQSFECTKYQDSCKQCPFVNKPFSRLPRAELLSIKNGYGNHSNLSVIAPSEWIYNKARESAVMRQSSIVRIYNAIDKIYAQELPMVVKSRSKFVVTFVAQELRNEYKGFDTLLNCMSAFYSEFKAQEIEFQFVGQGKKVNIKDLVYRQYSKIDEAEMKNIYLDTDLLIVPSSADNSPNIIFEALACGVPFVGSDRGGIPELAAFFNMEIFEYGNSASMYNAIIKQKIKAHDPKRLREKVLSLTDPERVAKRHLELYKSKLMSAD